MLCLVWVPPLRIEGYLIRSFAIFAQKVLFRKSLTHLNEVQMSMLEIIIAIHL